MSVTSTPVTLPPVKLIFEKPLPAGAALVSSPCGTVFVESVIVASGSAGDHRPVYFQAGEYGVNTASTSSSSVLPETLTVTFVPTVSAGSSGIHTPVSGSRVPVISSPLSSVTWTPVTLPPLKLIFLKPLPSGASLVISPCGTLLVESVVVASGSAGDQTPV